MAKTYEVKAKAPVRQGHGGYHSAQRFFPGGETLTHTVTGRELREMLEDDKHGRLLVENADQLREQVANDPDAGAGATSQVSVTQEELAALEAFRTQKSSGQATISVPASPGISSSTDTRGEGGKSRSGR